MATIKNPWVGYLQRSYKQVKASLLSKMGSLVPELSDHSESNLMVIILDSFAGVAESLNYYIDNAARESFISTARRWSSAVKLSRLVDYRIKSYKEASVTLLIEFLDSDGNPYALTSTADIPLNTNFYTDDGINFSNPLAYDDIPIGSTQAELSVLQGTFIVSENLGTLKGLKNEIIEIPGTFSETFHSLIIEGNLWSSRETLAFSGPEDQHYIIFISTSKKVYVKFGDGINGVIPPANVDAILSYLNTQGATGNVAKNTIINTDFEIGEVNRIRVSNPLAASGGADIESLESLKRSIPISTRTRERAVSRQDYIDVANLTPGVRSTAVKYICGDPYISLYIYPEGGGIAENILLGQVEGFMENKKMFSTIVKAFPAGESYILIDAEITGKASFVASVINTQVQEALEAAYSSISSFSNRNIRESDIISIIDNQNSVDYLKFNGFKVISFLSPLLHSNVVNVIIDIIDKPDFIQQYKLLFNNSLDIFQLFKGNTLETSLVKETPYTQVDNHFTIEVPLTQPDFGDTYFWSFYMYPEGDVELLDYSVPVIDWTNSDIIINEVK